MLPSDNLTEDKIRNTFYHTQKIATMFQALADQGYGEMNLKLVIDLLDDIKSDNNTEMPPW